MNHYEEAIQAVKSFLIDLLNKDEYCQAKQVGRALEILIDNRNKITQTEINQKETCKPPEPDDSSTRVIY